MVRLHVNIDHVATVRQARRGESPDPVAWALAAERAGAHGITCHLRGDRRHIQDDDVSRLRAEIKTVLNLELSLASEMVGIALKSGATCFCLVPENRQEITTEGGLDVLAEKPRLLDTIPRLAETGGLVSLFIDPDPDQIAATAEIGAAFVELHTGAYATATGQKQQLELQRLIHAAELAHQLGLRVNAGHGLNYENTHAVLAMPYLEELNIGHSIVARALTVGVDKAIGEMLDIFSRAS
ncbi:MAG: pyridoxine 5-phosphate synthase [Planctomycetota bacterium]|jgi:pyridoxine 5-phosphate synthase